MITGNWLHYHVTTYHIVNRNIISYKVITFIIVSNLIGELHELLDNIMAYYIEIELYGEIHRLSIFV